MNGALHTLTKCDVLNFSCWTVATSCVTALQSACLILTLKWHEFAMKFNFNVPFTTYYGLVNAIPKNWKTNLTNPIPNVTQDTTVNSLRTSSIYSLSSFLPLPKPTFYATDLQKIPSRKFILCHLKSQTKLK